MAEKDHRNDEQFAIETEFNIYECFHKKYSNATTEEDRQKCLEDYLHIYPTSKYDISKNCIENRVFTQDVIREHLDNKLQKLEVICRQIQEKQKLKKKDD